MPYRAYHPVYSPCYRGDIIIFILLSFSLPVSSDPRPGSSIIDRLWALPQRYNHTKSLIKSHNQSHPFSIANDNSSHDNKTLPKLNIEPMIRSQKSDTAPNPQLQSDNATSHATPKECTLAPFSLLDSNIIYLLNKTYHARPQCH
jgi:hypothetical protein